MQVRVEIEHVFEIFAAVARRLFHLANSDEVEHNLAKIARRIDAPAIEYTLCHEAELLQSKAADRFAQFLSGNVVLFSRLRGAHGQILLAEPQRLEDKEIGGRRVTPIVLENLRKRMRRVNLHGS